MDLYGKNLDSTVNIIGGGGHAKVVISTLRAAGRTVAGIYDDNPALKGMQIMGVPVCGRIEDIRGAPRQPAIIAIGDNRIRQQISAAYALPWATAVHPQAWIDSTVLIEQGTVVFAGAIIQPDAKIGAHAIINTAATVDHDCVLGSFSQLAPGTHLSGQVEVGKGAFLGTGSGTIQRVRIGSWTIVGAGAMVIADLPDAVTAVGVPARVLRRTQ